LSGSQASVAHLAERLPRKEKATRSIRVRGSMRSWRNGRRAWSRATWSARTVEVQLLSGARRPPWRNWKRSSPVPGRLPGRIRQEAPMAGCSVGRGRPALTRDKRRWFDSSPVNFRACLVTTAACRSGTAAVGVRFPGQAPRGCSSEGRAPPGHGGGHGFEARYPLSQGALGQLAEPSGPDPV
jgi:hypothetical protein